MVDINVVKKEMKLWRAGLTCIPASYIKIHRDAAKADLPRLAETHGLRVIAIEMISNGWCDGMRTVRAICEDKGGKFRDIRWTDSNGGSWFEHNPASGGSALFELSENRPGFL